ncbi:MAG: hypothetical protein ABI604_11125 [Nitrospirota bacterium]
MSIKRTLSCFVRVGGKLCVAICVQASLAAAPNLESGLTVVDHTTGKPIEKAFVVYIWDHRPPASFHSAPAICNRVEAIPTDVNGVAKMPQIKGLPAARLHSVYKEGLDGVSSKGGIYRMSASKESPAARFTLIVTQSEMHCSSEATKNLVEYYRAVHKEAEALANTPFEKDLVRGLSAQIAGLDAKAAGPAKRAEERK